MPSPHAERRIEIDPQKILGNRINWNSRARRSPQRSTSRAIFEEYQIQGQSLRGNSTVEGRPDKRRHRLQSLL